MLKIADQKSKTQKKRLLITTLSLAVAMVSFISFGVMYTSAKPSPENKVDVCHIEGNGSYHLINVSKNALQAHLDHGDALLTNSITNGDEVIFNSDCSVSLTKLNSVTVDSKDLDGVDSNIVLTDDVNYVFRASGTYTYASWAGGPIADAKYSYRTVGDPLGYSDEWVDGADLLSPYTNFLQIWINGSPVDWQGNYNVGHVYTLDYTGEGSDANFYINDGGAVGDNDGELIVDIYEQI